MHSHHHDQLYKHIIHIHLHMHAEHNETIKTSDTVLKKNIPLTLFERVVSEPEQNCNILTPHSIGHNRVSFLLSWAAQPGAWGPTLLGAGFVYCILSPTRLLPNWFDLQTAWLPVFTELYNSSTLTFFLCASQIALIQPIHGQRYTLLFLDRMHLLFTQVHFLF